MDINLSVQYALRELKFSEFRPLINNRTLIFSNIMEVKRKGVKLNPTY